MNTRKATKTAGLDPLRWIVGGFFVFLFLSLTLLSASPHLHASLHDEAHESEHECAITLYAHGVTTLDEVPVPSALWETLQVVQTSAVQTFFGRGPFTLPLGRAPPQS